MDDLIRMRREAQRRRSAASLRIDQASGGLGIPVPGPAIGTGGDAP